MNSSPIKTYNNLFENITQNFENKTFLNFLQNSKYESISVTEFNDKVFCLSLALKDLGVKPEDRIAIFSKSSPFWLIFDFAIHQLGAVSVPVFANISTYNLNFELKDAEVSFIFIDDENRVNDIEEKIAKNLIFITHNFCIKEDNFYNYDELLIISKQHCDTSHFKTYEADENDIFSIIYTSGNTGTPKGVMLSHKNILSQIYDIDSLIELDKEEVILSLLPLAHIYERTVMSYYLSKGVSVYFVDEITNVANLLKIVKPTMMTAVPRLLEKIFNKIKLNISEKPLISRTIASLAFSYAMRYDIDKDAFLYKLFDKIVYVKFREIFGARLQRLVSGGAPLNIDVCNFFVNIGVDIYQGYGQCEFSPVIATNAPNQNKVGSCGKLIASAQIKFLDKEILVKGPSLMQGYLNNPELTAQTIDKDGWLHTGDVGHIDDQGYLYVNSRKKEIFKTSTGEYVNSVFIEQEISKNKYVEFAVIFANNRQYVSALLFVDKDKYIARKDKSLSIEEYYSDTSILNDIKKHIEHTNNKLSKTERVIKYKLITNDISIETGELTPSMKICRNKIEVIYKNEIDSMY
jgi:long-chain acyl-CoA synthetase